MIIFDLYTPRISRNIIEIEADKSGKTYSIQQMPNGGTRIFCTFIGAGESVVLLELGGDEDNPKTEHRWYDRVKDSVEYVSKNWGPLVFVLAIVLDKFCGM